MFHALALIKIKDGGSEKFFEPFFKITFIDRHFAAEFLDGQRLSDMLQQNFPRQNDFFTILFIGQKLALELLRVTLAQHTFQTVQEQHLDL